MRDKLGQLFATSLGLLLLVYSASRTIDFISLTLPPERQILAWFGLAALDGGLLAWMAAYLYGSNGGWQRAISLVMVVIDLLGVIATFTLDTIYNVGQAGLTAVMSPQTLQNGVLAISGIIGLNIGAVVAHHLTSPETMRRMAEEDARHTIEDETLKLIHQNSRQLAAEMAPRIANAWRDSTVLEYGHRLRKARETQARALSDGDGPRPDTEPESPNPTPRRRSKSSD